jgi:hypothetical protein
MKYLWIIILLIITFLAWKVIKMENEDNNHIVILVPGLNDSSESKLIKDIWKRNGIDIIFFESRWKSDEKYQNKLERLSRLIDKESKNNKVSLIGISAGGSLVINAFNERRNQINKIVTICSRLKKGNINGFRGFNKMTYGYPTFRESVIKAEEIEKYFEKKDRQKIMTIHALLGDELVPANTTTIDQSKNTIVPAGGHIFSIVSSLTWYSKTLVKFLIN